MKTNAPRHWRKSGDRMRDLRADRRAVGLIETTVWVPAGMAAEARELTWEWCERYLIETEQMERYEAAREASLQRDKDERPRLDRRPSADIPGSDRADIEMVFPIKPPATFRNRMKAEGWCYEGEGQWRITAPIRSMAMTMKEAQRYGARVAVAHLNSKIGSF